MLAKGRNCLNPKTNDHQKPENYRGNALIPVGLKILCALVIARFAKILNERRRASEVGKNV